jgi:hypothetical protein
MPGSNFNEDMANAPLQLTCNLFEHFKIRVICEWLPVYGENISC